MGHYVIKRVMMAVPLLLLITLVSFVIIQLPPGDYLTTYIARLSAAGQEVNDAEKAALTKLYGLDRPMYVQYLYWLGGILRGNFGMSFDYNQPVNAIIWDRVGLTAVIAVCSLIFSWVVGFFVGTYAATHQYSIGDYFFTFLGFIGLAVPGFLLALILMWVAFAYFGQSVGGLFSPEYQTAPWSVAKFIDMVGHLWIPTVIVGLSGTAVNIRVLRANLLDELNKPYVITARAKGLPEWRVLYQYPLRIALIPFVSVVGWSLPLLVSGEVITSVVLSLPTSGPVLLQALQSQDMYLAGSFILLLSMLTVIGTLVSDILLAMLDPRIRYE